MNISEQDFPWALFNLSGTVYGISCERIKSILILKDVVPMPDMPGYIRGMINLRGSIIQITDLRKLYKMKSVQEEVNELQNLINMRKEDHINWITTLENSVKEKKEFKLTTDPHACAFGKWYDSYKSNDNTVNYLMRKFDEPHKKIHSIAIEVKHLEERGEYSQALDLIEKTKSIEFQLMVNLFSSFIEEFTKSRRELVIVLENDKTALGVTVDEVISIEPILENSEVLLEGIIKTQSKSLSIGKRIKDGSPVILIDDMYFFNL